MIKGVKITAVNSNEVGTQTTIYNMLSIPTGKTFILTDLVVVATTGLPNTLIPASATLLKLWDFVGAGATDASGVASIGGRLHVHLDVTGSGAAFAAVGKVMHFTNGPEFTNGVTPQVDNANIINTNCLWIGGIIR